VRQLYHEKRYYFIVSISAKSKVWLGYVKPKHAAFAGLHGLLKEIASVLPGINSELKWLIPLTQVRLYIVAMPV
jgi:hypothetical protein